MVMVRPLVSKFLDTVSTLQSRPCRDWEITRPLAAGQPPATGRDIALLRCLRWRSHALASVPVALEDNYERFTNAKKPLKRLKMTILQGNWRKQRFLTSYQNWSVRRPATTGLACRQRRCRPRFQVSLPSPIPAGFSFSVPSEGRERVRVR